MKRDWVLLFVSMLGFAACETVVEVRLPPHEAQLVAYSFFAPDSLWRVHVSTSVSATGSHNPDFGEDATVEIWQGERLVERLATIGQGTYLSSSNRPEPATRYTLRVTAPGVSEAEATASVPPAARITGFEQQLVKTDGTFFGQRIVKVALTLDDPHGVRNYYGLQVLQDRRVVNDATGEVTVLPRSTVRFASNDLVFGAADVFDPEKTYYEEALFTDDLFEGRSHTLDFEMEYTVDLRDVDVTVERSFGVLVMAVSEDYYRYWQTASLQNDVEGNPFAEPVRIYSNMSGGNGVFAGYQATFFPLETSEE